MGTQHLGMLSMCMERTDIIVGSLESSWACPYLPSVTKTTLACMYPGPVTMVDLITPREGKELWLECHWWHWHQQVFTHPNDMCWGPAVKIAKLHTVYSLAAMWGMICAKDLQQNSLARNLCNPWLTCTVGYLGMSERLSYICWKCSLKEIKKTC